MEHSNEPDGNPLTGGTFAQQGMIPGKGPKMFQIQMASRALTDKDVILKFRVSHDCQRAALVTGEFKILIYKLIFKNEKRGHSAFSTTRQFNDATQIVDIPNAHKDFNDIFLYQSRIDGTYGMYIASMRGILVYKNIDPNANDGFIPYSELSLDPTKIQQM